MKRDFYINLVAGIGLGIAFVFMLYAFCIGMDREARRQELLSDYYCEHYGACGGAK